MPAKKIIAIFIALILHRVPLRAQELPFSISGPPVPQLPTTIARDGEGRATLRAVQLELPLKIDGKLDERLYDSALPISDFIQTEPKPGEPATEKTEVWISFDRANVYVSVRAWETRPERVIANEMRRDNNTIWQNDGVGFSFDTFLDRRNDYLFNVNPVGGRTDGHVMNEGTINNNDWNPVWNFATAKFENGWTVEAAIPFKSLRYRGGSSQVWGFQMRRNNRWKNEISYLTAVSNGRGYNGVNQMSRAATLVGIEAPDGSRNIEVKPYAVGSLTSDVTAIPNINNKADGDVGLDVKYGLTQNLTADVTFNTDFAQVEADEQQINLTRFSLFFPEKREFFLENQGLFQFGATNNFASSSQVPILFYSRRIGLDNEREIPIRAGGRLTGRVGRYSIGALTIGTKNYAPASVPAANFAVMRIKRDILRKSSIGTIFTRRSTLVSRAGSNEAYGVDAALAFYNNLAINSYWARANTDGLTTDNESHRLQLDYNADRYGIQAERLAVGANFSPEVGYVQRRDMRSHYGMLRFSPRPKSIRSVRKFSWQASFSNIDDGRGRLETRTSIAQFGIEFQNGDRFNINYSDNYEFLKRPFSIVSGVPIPVGGYNFGNFHTEYTLGVGRTLAGTVSLDQGGFYSGDKTSVGYRTGRVKISPKISVEPGITLNRISLPVGTFNTNLVSSRATYTMTPFMFVSALIQYNSTTHSVSTNARFRWEYTAGSELFVVYNDNRDTRTSGFPDLQNRSLIVKVNRLFRF